MYSRIISVENNKSFFIFGARGTGKSTWLKAQYQDCLYIDLLETALFQELAANPSRLENLIVDPAKIVVIDEIQKIPDLLDEVHRLIEAKKVSFILTGSSARKLRRSQSNLLAGRALTYNLYPLTAKELGADFDLSFSLQNGHLPAVFSEPDKKLFLKSYVSTYLKEEVINEGLTRSLSAFSRFLEVASFSQASVLNVSSVAREAGVERKVIENYFEILEDLLIAIRLPVFQRKAKRKMSSHPKFYYFDVGVFNSIRPRGPLEDDSSIRGAALETLVLQELRAMNQYCKWDYSLSFWRSLQKEEVDFVLYGERGFYAIEVKLSQRLRGEYLKSLKEIKKDYPNIQRYFLYTGDREYEVDDIRVLNVEKFLRNIESYI